MLVKFTKIKSECQLSVRSYFNIRILDKIIDNRNISVRVYFLHDFVSCAVGKSDVSASHLCYVLT